MQDLTIKITFEIAAAILNVRHCGSEVDRTEAEMEALDAYSQADKRTRPGKAYMAAKKEWEQAVWNYRRVVNELATEVAIDAVTDQALRDLMEETILTDPVLNELIAETVTDDGTGWVATETQD